MTTTPELLSKVVSLKHPDAAYISTFMKLLDLNDDIRRQGKVDLFKLRKSKGGLTYIEGCRMRLRNKLFKLNNYFPWYKPNYPPLGVKHPPTHFASPMEEFRFIKCKDCMAEFEVMCIFDQDYFDDMIYLSNRVL